MNGEKNPGHLRLAAVADLHCAKGSKGKFRRLFAGMRGAFWNSRLTRKPCLGDILLFGKMA